MHAPPPLPPPPRKPSGNLVLVVNTLKLLGSSVAQLVFCGVRRRERAREREGGRERERERERKRERERERESLCAAQSVPYRRLKHFLISWGKICLNRYTG